MSFFKRIGTKPHKLRVNVKVKKVELYEKYLEGEPLSFNIQIHIGKYSSEVFEDKQVMVAQTKGDMTGVDVSFLKTMYIGKSGINELMMKFDIKDSKDKKKQLCNMNESVINISSYMNNKSNGAEINFEKKKPNDMIKKISFTVQITGDDEESQKVVTEWLEANEKFSVPKLENESDSEEEKIQHPKHNAFDEEDHDHDEGDTSHFM